MEPHERFDEALQERIDELDMTWGDLSRVSGVHEVTLRALRRGENKPSARTKRRIEDAVQWARGSIDAIYGGGSPTLAPHKAGRGRRSGTFAEEAAKVDEGLKELSAILEEALERQRGRPLTETQRRVTIEWTNSLERTIDALDEEAG